jgi:hypothetical protein
VLSVGERFGSDDKVSEEVAVSTEFHLVQEDRWSCFLLLQSVKLTEMMQKNEVCNVSI